MKFIRLLVISLTTALCAVTLFGQIRRGYPEANSQPPKADRDRSASEQQEALAEQIVADRESPGREFAPALRAAILNALKTESVTELQSHLSSGRITSNLLGDTNRDLVYTPVPLCRIIDTRIAGGALVGGSPGTTRSLKVAGTTGFELQGGTMGGCAIPVGATAVLINFVAVNAAGPGNLKGSAFPNPVPAQGSVINYAAVSGLNIANGLLFPICDPATTTCSADINLAANGTGVDVVADVMGYAMRTPKEQLKPIIVGDLNGTTTTIGTTCTNFSGLSVTVNAPVAGTIYVHGQVMLQVTHTTGNDNNLHINLTTSPGSCISSAWGADLVFWNSNYYPAGTNFPTFSLSRSYTVTAGSSTTFYIDGMKFANTGDDPMQFFNGGSLVAEFVPN